MIITLNDILSGIMCYVAFGVIVIGFMKFVTYVHLRFLRVVDIEDAYERFDIAYNDIFNDQILKRGLIGAMFAWPARFMLYVMMHVFAVKEIRSSDFKEVRR